MLGEVLTHKMLEVLPIADALAAGASAKPPATRRVEFLAEDEAGDILQTLRYLLPGEFTGPTYEIVYVRRLRRRIVQSPAASKTDVISDPEQSALRSLVKQCRRSPGCVVISASQCLVRWQDTLVSLNEAARIVGIPGAVGVEGKEVDRHGSGCRCYLRLE